MSTIENMTPEEIIKRIGGNAAAAKLCEITPAAVSQWLTNGIPKSRLMFIRLARPDIFAAPRRSRRPPTIPT